MNKTNKFSSEVRERAVRMVQEHRGEYPSLWATVESIAPKIGCAPEIVPMPASYPTMPDATATHAAMSSQKAGRTTTAPISPTGFVAQRHVHRQPDAHVV